MKRINLLLFLMLAFSLILIGWVDLVWWQKVVLIFVILIVYGYVIIKGLKMRKTELQLEELESTKQKIFDRASGSFRHIVEPGGRYLYILRTGGRVAKCETGGMVAGGDEGRIFLFKGLHLRHHETPLHYRCRSDFQFCWREDWGTRR